MLTGGKWRRNSQLQCRQNLGCECGKSPRRMCEGSRAMTIVPVPLYPSFQYTRYLDCHWRRRMVWMVNKCSGLSGEPGLESTMKLGPPCANVRIQLLWSGGSGVGCCCQRDQGTKARPRHAGTIVRAEWQTARRKGEKGEAATGWRTADGPPANATSLQLSVKLSSMRLPVTS